MTVKNSKFDHEYFYDDDFNELAISKQKYTKEEAIKVAKDYFGTRKESFYLAIGNNFTRHRVGRDSFGDRISGWFLEGYDCNKSCPVYTVHEITIECIEFHKKHHKEYEYVLVNAGSQKSN